MSVTEPKASRRRSSSPACVPPDPRPSFQNSPEAKEMQRPPLSNSPQLPVGRSCRRGAGQPRAAAHGPVPHGDLPRDTATPSKAAWHSPPPWVGRNEQRPLWRQEMTWVFQPHTERFEAVGGLRLLPAPAPGELLAWEPPSSWGVGEPLRRTQPHGGSRGRRACGA